MVNGILPLVLSGEPVRSAFVGRDERPLTTHSLRVPAAENHCSTMHLAVEEYCTVEYCTFATHEPDAVATTPLESPPRI